MAPAACPCGRLGPDGKPLALAACCGRYLGDALDTPAPDAESLMRSRYSAFVLGNEAYLLATWHPSTRPQALDFEPGARWLGLEVRGTWLTGPDDSEVAFVARYRIGGRAVRLQERSRFVREDARWFYVDGQLS